VIPFEFYQDIRHLQQSPWAIVRRCLDDPVFSLLSRTPTSDRQTDGHTMTAYTVLSA